MTPPTGTGRPSAIAIAGTHSGVGKTSVTLGLIGALTRRGLNVQPFKVGPDFIDPLHHTHVSGRRSRNLDGWMLSAATNRAIFRDAAAGADVAVLEGVMGLFDGSEGSSDRGSTAEMAKLLDVPVLLVIDASAMARSAAALIHGFASFDPDLRIAGVILNRVGGEAHAAMIEEAVDGGPPILGAIPHSPELVVPERHLGLHLPHEARRDYAAALADLIERNVQLERLLAVGRPASEREGTPAATDASEPTHATDASDATGAAAAGPAQASEPAVRIGVARDEAFCFYYAENLELLERAGAELVEFSPIRDELPGDLDGLYIGGGYPELHAEALAANTAMLSAIRELAAGGAPVYAECGGLMYLGEELEVDGVTRAMCGVLPFGTRIPAPLKLAYVDVETSGGGPLGGGHTARGHLFHHSEIAGAEPDVERCYELRTTRAERVSEGYCVGNVLASYVHVHFASSPAIASALVDRCRRRSAAL